jgi:monothiol glutaredoxin
MGRDDEGRNGQHEERRIEMSDANTRIRELVEKNKIVLFMKGTKSFPQCGFSNALVEVLKREGVPFETVNVLADPEMRQGIKEFSSWPTIPQLYVGGKFLGGCDIVTEMHQNGELAKELAAAGVEKVAPKQSLS